MSWRCVFLVSLLFSIGGSAMAKDPTSARSLSSPKEVTRDQQPLAKRAADEKGANEKRHDVKNSLPQEHVIYIPFKNLPDVFEREDSSVVLPYAQFLEMWKQLSEPQPKPVRPPVDGVITRADYVGSVKGELVDLEATLDVEVLDTDWARLPLKFGDAAIGSARSEDGAALLRGAGEGTYELLVHGKGKHKITLGLMAAVKSNADGYSVTVQCPSVGVSNLELRIPAKDLAVHLVPQRTMQQRSEAKDATSVRAAIGATNQFTVSWQPKSGNADNAAGLADVTDMIAVDVGDGVVHTHAIFDYHILRGSLPELTVEMPADQRLLDVQVPGLRDWQTETAGGRQRVKVRLHAPATEAVCLEMHTESPIPAQAFQVGCLRVVGMARENGTLALRGGEDVGLETVDRQSVTRIDAADAPSSMRKPGSTFYKFFTPEHKLSVVASQLTPRIVVASHLSIVLDKSRLTTRGAFKYHITRSGVFALTFRLPAGFQVDEVRTDLMERFEVAPAAGAQTLTVYFTKKTLGDVTVTVTASRLRDKSGGELTLPLIEPLNVTREEGLAAVIAPESLEVKTEAGRLQAARSATPAELTSQGFEPQVPPGSSLAAAFSFVTRPVRVVQTIAERPRRTVVVVSTAANVKEDIVQVTTTLRYQVQFAGTDAFRIAVPAAVSDRLRVDGEGIKERRKSASADGVVEWTIMLHSEVIGPSVFTAAYDQKRAAGDKGAQIKLRPIKPLEVDRETGEIAVFKDRELSLSAESKGLEEIDPRELSQPVGTTQPHLTYRYYQHPAELTLSVTKHELQDVVKTVVRYAYVEAVVTEDGPITMRARYSLKSSERQRLAVTLCDPRILGVTVAGQSVAPEKAPAAAGSAPDDKTYFINVARTTDSDEPFEIAMVFETPGLQKVMKITDVLRLPLPRFDRGMKFQKVYVRVWMPKEYRLVGDPGGFTSHIGVGYWDSREITAAADNPDSWFGKDSTSFDFQAGGTTYLFSSLADPAELKIDYWHIATMTAIASAAALLVGLVLLGFSLETKVLTVFALVFAVALAGLFVPFHIYSWLLAARPGIAGVVALWLIVWLLHLRQSGAFTPAPVVQNVTGSAQPPS